MSDALDAATQAATDALDAAEDAERFGYDKRDVLLARLVLAVERLAEAHEREAAALERGAAALVDGRDLANASDDP